ncbi:hypothetical protein MAPG_06462 [Magnaporthiopsis poae ATCC 64411]|uniref:Uncharacterized protein n=1 Tax=Magnaporthiopsis poae (strain ATCC 64411 / 73-15) TaxID=644358 RepID=A0A0C4E234_MAGP6|nr:hypothetical protein MAPG_06462 [Magnaporthiopsis poae ATCC 64411]
MALTIKHLNGDASFLLSFEPILAPGPRDAAILDASPFRILIDPWITGPSTVFHSKISISTHKNPACIASLQELPEPDLVVISQHKSDHCNETTLRQLPATGTKTLILAEPAAARVIKSWKYFDREKIRTIPKWGDSSFSARQSVVRIPLPPLLAGGEPGEVTVAFIPQRRDISGLHNAVGITYRPPASSLSPLPQPSGASYKRSLLFPRSASPAPTISSIITPPETPRSTRSSYLTPPQPRQQQSGAAQGPGKMISIWERIGRGMIYVTGGSSLVISSTEGRSYRCRPPVALRPRSTSLRDSGVVSIVPAVFTEEVLALGIGEQVVISNDGVWNAEAAPRPSPLLEEPSESTACCARDLGCVTLNQEAAAAPIAGAGMQ